MLSVVAAGCGSDSTNTNEIVIGHYGSMTGSEATFGISTDNGIKLAVEEINQAGGIGGKTIRLITYDDKGDAREAGPPSRGSSAKTMSSRFSAKSPPACPLPERQFVRSMASR